MHIKKILLLLSLLFLPNCHTIQQLNSNMQETNQVLVENVKIMEASKAAIEENSKQIQRSTVTMWFFPLIFVVSILILIYICLRFKIFHRIFKDHK